MRKRRRTRRRPMTSRSFDHRLLLLFFPGHETHSIHCEESRLSVWLRIDSTNFVVGRHATDLGFCCSRVYRVLAWRSLVASADIACAAILPPRRPHNHRSMLGSFHHTTSKPHTFVSLLSLTNLIKKPSPPHQVTHPTFYHPSPAPGSHTAYHIRPSSQQSA
jgi:hypothetical protein